MQRDERDGKRKYIILRYIILLCKYIILMSKKGKQKFGMWRYCKMVQYNDKMAFQNCKIE